MQYGRKSKSIKIAFSILLIALIASSCGSETEQQVKTLQSDDMIIRIAKLKIDSVYFDDYLAILKEEAAASLKLEAGVLCIYPMYQKINPTEIRLLEIYANEEAYQLHLKTPHFLHYKNTTSKMVKSLELIDMEAIDKATMAKIFKKL